MNNNQAAASSKARVGSSQPSETSFKRKRGVFQKDCQSSSSSLFLCQFIPAIRFGLKNYVSYDFFFVVELNSAAYDVWFWR